MTEIILLTVDSLRADHLTEGLFPRTWDHFQSDFALFENCISNGTTTQLSFPYIHTGQPMAKRGGIQSNIPTLADVYPGFSWALTNSPQLRADIGYSRGFDKFESSVTEASKQKSDHTVSKLKRWGNNYRFIRSLYYNIVLKLYARVSEPELLNSNTLLADSVTDKLISALESEEGFFWAHYMDPHSPFNHKKIPDRDFHTEHTNTEIKSMNNRFINQGATSSDINFLHQYYEESIKFLDRNLVKLFDFLQSEERWDDTMIVILSDHGECFDDEGQYWHGSDLLPVDELVQVPLLVKYAENKHTNSYSHPVQSADLLATVAEELCLDITIPDGTYPFTDDQARLIVSKSANGVRVTTESGYGIKQNDGEITIHGELSERSRRVLKNESPHGAEDQDLNDQFDNNKVEEQLEYLGYK